MLNALVRCEMVVGVPILSVRSAKGRSSSDFAALFAFALGARNWAALRPDWTGLTGEGETSSAILIHGLSASRSHSIHAAPRDWEPETVRRWKESLDKHSLARSSGRRIGCSRLGFSGASPNR